MMVCHLINRILQSGTILQFSFHHLSSTLLKGRVRHQTHSGLLSLWVNLQEINQFSSAGPVQTDHSEVQQALDEQRSAIHEYKWYHLPMTPQ